jgi:hypothetical protein
MCSGDPAADDMKCEIIREEMYALKLNKDRPVKVIIYCFNSLFGGI